MKLGEETTERNRSFIERLSDQRLKDESVKAVLLFGSRARGEVEERSDVDLLVLHDGCGIKDSVARRRHLYGLVSDAIGDSVESLTVLDMELKQFLEPREVTGLLLNIYWDASVLVDRTGLLNGFLERVRESVVRSGLKRVKDGKAYRWVLPEPMKEVRLL